MPNVITHGLMAQDVRSQLNAPLLHRAIDAHNVAYFLGSSGPDIFFYYNQWPWTNQDDAKVMHDLGNLIHKEKINAFYQAWIERIKQTDDQRTKEIYIAFLCGHLNHWALDTIAHPYIFNQSGPMEGKTRYWHYRMESMIDTKMCQNVKGLPLRKLHSSALLNVNAQERSIIAEAYAAVVRDVFAVACEGATLDTSIAQGVNILRIMHDPKMIKTKIIQLAEKLMNNPWVFSSHIVMGESDQYDELNLMHRTWCHPADDQDTSNASFLDLYDEAVVRGISTLEAFASVLENQRTSLDDILQDCSYDSGDALQREFRYYDSLYERGG